MEANLSSARRIPTLIPVALLLVHFFLKNDVHCYSQYFWSPALCIKHKRHFKIENPPAALLSCNLKPSRMALVSSTLKQEFHPRAEMLL